MSYRRDNAGRTPERPVPLRMRPDLVARAQLVGGDRYWVVKDPVALNYFHLREEEHTILRMLDGRTSLEEIERQFEELFAPQQTTLEHLNGFLGRLHRCGLVISDTPGQGEQLLLRRDGRRRQAWVQSAARILAIRFRGIDPEPLLGWLYPKCRWLFAKWAVAFGLFLVVLALGLAAVQFDVLRSRLPDFHAFFSAHNAVWLMLALALTKVLHEFGHALTCKHFGGECHELGILLLVFTPCLYCNVSDAWMLPNKWHRVAVSVAGVCVEMVLAAVCTFVWWFSEPGLLNTLCLNIMFVCSVSTLVFNGNPLLRFDGYYVLSDVVEVPNLRQESRSLLGRGLAKLAMGVESPPDRKLPKERNWPVALYGLASMAYLSVVIVGILWVCHEVLAEYRLELLANALAVVVIGGLITAPVLNFSRLLRNPAWSRRIRRGRAVLTCVGLIVLVVAVCLVPLPFRVIAPAVLEAEGGHRVYVSVPGTLVDSVAAGAVVEQGQTLARLVDLNVERQTEDLIGQRDLERLQLQNLEFRLGEDPAVAPQIPTARQALADVEERLRQRQRDQNRLTLIAPASGTVLPPPGLTARPYVSNQLQMWSGSPLDPHNRGCHLDTGTLLCLVGDPCRLEAVLVVEQASLVFVRCGQRVRLQLDELPGGVLGGTVAEIAKTELKVVPRELATANAVGVRVDEDGVPRPLDTYYQVRVSLDDPERRLLTGACGRGKVLVDAQPLGRRLYRYLRRTFSFKW